MVVDRLLKKLPHADPDLSRRSTPPGARPAAKAAPSASAPVRPSPARLHAGTWARLGLGVTLGVAITQWPYPHACGFALAGYLAVAVVVIASGVWSGILSWNRRQALAHLVSLGLVLWGLALVTKEVLPRVDYARSVASWTCR